MRLIALLGLVALAACSIAPIDYTGKACPCPDGYRCDLAVNMCTKTGIDDSRVDTRDGPMPDMTLPGTSCLTNPRSQLVYSSIGFADFPNGWFNTNGSFQKSATELTQLNSASPFSWASHAIPSMPAGDYRIVATMRLVDGQSDAGMGIVFRLGGGQGNSYSCTLYPRTSTLRLVSTTQQIDTTIASQGVVIGGDPTKTFTMEVDATGATLTCCLRSVISSTITSMNTLNTTGNAGIQTRDAEAAFGSFWAYQ